jgi:hypothetical protein
MLCAVAAEFREAAAAVVLTVVEEEVADCAARDINVGRSWTATPVRLRSFALPFRGGSTPLLVVDVIVAIVVEGETDCALFCAMAALSFRRATSSRVMEVAAMVALPPEHTTAR